MHSLEIYQKGLQSSDQTRQCMVTLCNKFSIFSIFILTNQIFYGQKQVDVATQNSSAFYDRPVPIKLDNGEGAMWSALSIKK